MHRSAATALLVLLAVTALMPSAGNASSYVMPTDDELLERSGLVVVGRVAGIDAAPGLVPSTDFTLEVMDVVKGFVPSGLIVVRELGGLSADGSSRMVVLGGAPLVTGEEYLLFLEEHTDGTFRVMEQALGAFWHDREHDLALRSLASSLEVVPGGDGLAAERRRAHLPRRFAPFVSSLKARARGAAPDLSYFVEADGLAGVRSAFNLTLSPAGNPPNGCPVNAGSPLRWREFDTSQPVTVLANEGGQPGVPGGGFAEIQQALAAWNAVAGARTSLSFGGTTPVSSAIDGVDLLNTILFEDPNDQIAGSFPSASSGTIALAVVFFSCETVHPFTGGIAHTLIEAGIVTQDGTGSFFFNSTSFAEVMAHEIGHLLGIAHSCGDAETGACSGAEANALMRAFVHDDGRGATLSTDDRNALLALYAEPGDGGPAAPTGLTATASSTSTVELAWNDVAGEDGYFLEQRIPPSTDFLLLGELPANTTSAQVTGLFPETAADFRVLAFNSQGFSPYSNVASATTFAVPGPCVADDQTLCLTDGRFKVTARWATSQGTSGAGNADPITPDTGTFWFFSEDNVEMVVKVLDACVDELGNRFWVFAGGLTDVEVVLTVVDSETGAARSYTNPQSTPFQPIQDTAAFETCP